jgi:hypothetical protein
MSREQAVAGGTFAEVVAGRARVAEGMAGLAAALTEACAELADTLADDYDVIDLAHRLARHCVRLLPVAEAAVLLAGGVRDGVGTTEVVAAAGDRARALALRQLEWAEGPAVDCARGGEPCALGDPARDAARWPRFAPLVRKQGFASGHALPLRRRSETVGALVLLREAGGGLSPFAVRAAAALAAVAATGILAERAVHERAALAGQLQSALTSRAVIEQAKGVLVARSGLDPDAAFTALHTHARNTGQRLGQLARDLVNGVTDASTIVG